VPDTTDPPLTVEPLFENPIAATAESPITIYTDASYSPSTQFPGMRVQFLPLLMADEPLPGREPQPVEMGDDGHPMEPPGIAKKRRHRRRERMRSTTTPIKSVNDELLAEIERQTKTGIKKASTHGHYELEAIDDITTELRRLRAENEALRGDKELLDWLADPENEVGNVQLPTKCVMENMGSLRDAIRQAMIGDTRWSK
jgi:hypothetical protein